MTNRCRYMQFHDIFEIYGLSTRAPAKIYLLYTSTHSLVTVQFFFFFWILQILKVTACLQPKKRKNFELNSIVSLLAWDAFQHLLNNNPVKVFKIRSELIFKSKFSRGTKVISYFNLQGVQVSFGGNSILKLQMHMEHGIILVFSGWIPIQWVVKIASRPWTGICIRLPFSWCHCLIKTIKYLSHVHLWIHLNLNIVDPKLS